MVTETILQLIRCCDLYRDVTVILIEQPCRRVVS